MAARAIGAIFDATVLSRHASRPLADTWIAWASRWTKRFGAEWAEMLQNARRGEYENADEPAAGGLPEPHWQPVRRTDSDPRRAQSFQCPN